MPRSPIIWLEWTKRANTALDSLLYRISVYGVPAIIVGVSVVALLAWPAEYATYGSSPLEFRVFEQTGETTTAAQAWARLKKQPAVDHHDTKRSESPFWFGFTVRLPDIDARTDVELPSRHALAVGCWDAAELNSLGNADRETAAGRMKRAKTGFVLQLDGQQSQQSLAVLCRSTFSGPGRITVVQWPESQFELSTQKFHRDSGLLDGGLIVLSLFVLLTAIINREWTYVLFAMWLMATLRLAANSAGWDTQWLEQTVPESLILPMRKLTPLAYYVTTITLFSRLFYDDLKNVGYTFLLRIVQWSCVPLLLVAILMPTSWWLLWLWASAAFTVVVLVFFLVRIIFITRSGAAMLYGASFGVTLLASLYEVVAAALGLKGLIGSINFVMAALSSALLAALAIAEQMRQERTGRVKAETELRSTYEAIPIGLFTLDENGVFLRGNPALRNMLGVDLSQSGQETWSEHFEPGAWERLQDMIRRKTSEELEIRDSVADDDSSRRFLVKATSAGDKIEGSLQDITQRSKATARLRFLAENDPLTEVLNRHGVEEAFAGAMQEAANGQPLALAYLDLDRFKLINDLFGHVAGDEVLKQVCGRVRAMLTDGHAVGRVGGDEFVIVFRKTPVRTATAICRGIVNWIGSSPYQIGDKAFQVKGSIGLVEVGAGTNVKDAISAADRACREAKKGANLVVYEKSESAFKERQEELRLIERLGTGVVPEGLFLVMQPIMSLRAPYDSLNFEILLRMRDVDGTVTSAGKIISAGENNGRSAVIDRWVMSNTLEWLDQHYDDLDRTRFACMNLSGASLNDERFIQDAFSMLARHGRAAGKLCIEITESVALHDLDNTRRFIDKARDFGAKVALDDFGAGYTSFSYLKELRADTLKIDGNFILGVNTHPANLAIVEAIVELARNLGMKSVAEWVEDLATIEALAEVGVDYVQGYVIARPQLPGKILGAKSSAGFIEDEKVALYVRNYLAKGQAVELWEQLRELKPKGLTN
ncbi:MAG: EAL domain-containing protein [Betaproteobacteria bacterium]|nr:MAG: EAL domain-containing protein [Betaproteobacteria bacterium]